MSRFEGKVCQTKLCGNSVSVHAKVMSSSNLGGKDGIIQAPELNRKSEDCHVAEKVLWYPATRTSKHRATNFGKTLYNLFVHEGKLANITEERQYIHIACKHIVKHPGVEVGPSPGGVTCFANYHIPLFSVAVGAKHKSKVFSAELNTNAGPAWSMSFKSVSKTLDNIRIVPKWYKYTFEEVEFEARGKTKNFEDNQQSRKSKEQILNY